jgi:hypothetical protein
MEKWELLNLFQEWDWGIKENNRGCEFNSDILYELLYMSHYDPSTTIKNMLWLPWQYLHLCWHVLFASQQLSLWQHRKFFWVALGFELRAYMLATLSAFCLVIFFSFEIQSCKVFVGAGFEMRSSCSLPPEQ